jgi:hypothetical protein
MVSNIPIKIIRGKGVNFNIKFSIFYILFIYYNTFKKMSEQPLIQSPGFDQIVKGNVSIKKLSKDKYRITFSKIGKFLLYQVWDKDSVNLNKKRSVGYVSAKQWIKNFKRYNTYLDNNYEPSFTPTTIMETEDGDVYAFVIHKAYLNSCGKVVFTVSTNEISLANNTSKKLVRLPEGKCNNVRFDIDDVFSTMNEVCGGTPDSACARFVWSQFGENVELGGELWE